MDVKQVIVVRMRYPDGKGGTRKIRWGKLGAQIAHASWKVLLDRKLQFLGESGEPLPLHSVGFVPEDLDASGSDRPSEPMHITGLTTHYLLVPLNEPMAQWVHGEKWKKVVLGVDTEEDLLRCFNEAKARGLPTALVTDHGMTEFKKECSVCGGEGKYTGEAGGFSTEMVDPCDECGGAGSIGVPTHTAVAIGPALSPEIDVVTGRDGLVKTRLL